MSLTLRDAQHLCWETFKKLEHLNQKSSTPLDVALTLTKTAEDITRKLRQSENSKDAEDSAKLLSELLYLALILAEQQGIELEDDFLQTIDGIILGSIG